MNKYYKVSTEEITKAEEKMELSFPNELKEFYLKNGYGFFDSKLARFNRLMDPLSVADFRLKQNDYDGMESMDLYDPYKDSQLVFFEVAEGLFLSIELTTKSKQKIYLFDKVVANSLDEFIKKYTDDETSINMSL